MCGGDRRGLCRRVEFVVVESEVESVVVVVEVVVVSTVNPNKLPELNI